MCPGEGYGAEMRRDSVKAHVISAAAKGSIAHRALRWVGAFMDVFFGQRPKKNDPTLNGPALPERKSWPECAAVHARQFVGFRN